MKSIARQWFEKGCADLLTAERELSAAPPNFDAAAFHAQQCAEKCLKARLVEADVAFPKTHDLAAILGLALPHEPQWEVHRGRLEALTSLAVEVRYPGCSAEESEAREAIETARLIRDAVDATLKRSED